MKILVPGASGQVGCELLRLEGADLVGLDRRALDVTDAAAVRQAVAAHRPDVVINAAAYTAVDRAEAEPETVFAVNRDGAAHLADACAEAGIPLVHLSTDYVFDGTKGAPYTEADPVNPLGVYGQSKWAGEEAVRERLARHVILRTSWVFSAHGANFVKTMLRLARERAELRVVADQHGCPTAAADVAATALRVAQQITSATDAPWGIYHVAGTPATTWHGFAEAIVAEARRHTTLAVERVEPITTADYPTAAARPADSRLDTRRLRDAFGIEPQPWQPALRAVVEAVLQGEG